MMKNFFSMAPPETLAGARGHGDKHQPDQEKENEARFGSNTSPYQDSAARDDTESVELDTNGPTVTSSNPTKLFSYIIKRNWPAVVKRCKGADSREARTWVVEKNRDGSIRWKLLPIHQACENKAPSEVVKALIAVYPDSLRMKDSAGDLPLHLACRERASKAVIAAILSEEPGAAKVRDDEGRLPLHLACRQGTAVQVVDSLIVCYFRGTRTPDAYALLPIHWACAQNASPSVVEALLRANPDSRDYKDKWGRTPVSLAQASTNPEKEVVIDYLKKDPSYWSTDLVDRIDSLSKKLEKSSTKEKESQSKLHLLESENVQLKEEINRLSTTNMYTDEDIEKINEENNHMLEDIKKYQYKLKEFSGIFKAMESQRTTLLRVTDDMEKALKKVTDIAGDDYKDWKKAGAIAKKIENKVNIGNFKEME